MTKLDILCELHAVIGARLFGEGPWLMEREDALLTRQRVLEMELEKQVTEDTWQHTPFAEEIDFDLLSVFMGWQDEGDIPSILEQRGLVTKAEADSMHEQWAKCHDPERAMKRYVRKAYLRCFRPPKRRRAPQSPPCAF
jgi:hypothetical protein